MARKFKTNSIRFHSFSPLESKTTKKSHTRSQIAMNFSLTLWMKDLKTIIIIVIIIVCVQPRQIVEIVIEWNENDLAMIFNRVVDVLSSEIDTESNAILSTIGSFHAFCLAIF